MLNYSIVACFDSYITTLEQINKVRVDRLKSIFYLLAFIYFGINVIEATLNWQQHNLFIVLLIVKIGVTFSSLFNLIAFYKSVNPYQWVKKYLQIGDYLKNCKTISQRLGRYTDELTHFNQAINKFQTDTNTDSDIVTRNNIDTDKLIRRHIHRCNSVYDDLIKYVVKLNRV